MKTVLDRCTYKHYLKQLVRSFSQNCEGAKRNSARIINENEKNAALVHGKRM